MATEIDPHIKQRLILIINEKIDLFRASLSAPPFSQHPVCITMTSMKQTLDHLPEQKQYELRQATEILLETVAPEMIILFGSYARGDWQEELADDGHHYQYQSDFDLLLVTKNDHQAVKIGRKESLRKRLSREIKTPVSLIAEDISHVNQNLRQARYFYVDILKEGVLLHDSGALQLGEPKELHPAERKKMAEEDLAHWFGKAKSMMLGYDTFIQHGEYNDAAFMLHQATERAYAAALLVFTHYKPRTHDLAKIGERITAVEPEFLKAFPKGTEDEKRMFELLRSAYVDARYLKSYVITADELTWQADRVRYLHQLVVILCTKQIATYC